MHKKQYLALIIAIVLCIFVSGCGTKTANDAAENTQETSVKTEVESNDTKENNDNAINTTLVNGVYVDSYDGLIVVKNESGKLYGVEKLDGKMLVDFEYDDIDLFTNEGDVFFKVKYEGKYGVLNSKGKEVLPVEYKEIEFAPLNKTNYFVVTNSDSQIGVVDSKKKEIIPLKYDASNESDAEINYAIRTVNDKYFCLFEQHRSSVNGAFVDSYATVIDTDEKELYKTAATDDVFGVKILDSKGDLLCVNKPGMEESFAEVVSLKDGSVLKQIDGLINEIRCDGFSDLVCVNSIVVDKGMELTLYNQAGKYVGDLDLGENISLAGWDQQGNVIACDTTTKTYTLLDAKTKEVIETFESAPVLQQSDKFVLVGNKLTDKKGKLIMEVPAEKAPALLNEYVLYFNSDADTYKLIDENEEPVYDERYFGCYSAKDGDHVCYILENSEDEHCLISDDGILRVDYGVIDLSDGEMYFEDHYIDDVIISPNYIMLIHADEGEYSEEYVFAIPLNNKEK